MWLVSFPPTFPPFSLFFSVGSFFRPLISKSPSPFGVLCPLSLAHASFRFFLVFPFLLFHDTFFMCFVLCTCSPTFFFSCQNRNALHVYAVPFFCSFPLLQTCLLLQHALSPTLVPHQLFLWLFLAPMSPRFTFVFSVLFLPPFFFFEPFPFCTSLSRRPPLLSCEFPVLSSET